jgi:hypothetical protein
MMVAIGEPHRVFARCESESYRASQTLRLRASCGGLFHDDVVLMASRPGCVLIRKDIQAAEAARRCATKRAINYVVEQRFRGVFDRSI